MKNISLVEKLGNVVFPPFMGERIYMREFYLEDGLPEDIKHWQSTVDCMLDGIETDGPIYLMVDQKELKKGQMHRRGGIHCDGWWNPIQAHGVPGQHRNPYPSHRVNQPRHLQPNGYECAYSHGPDWKTESIILSSNVEACEAWRGEWEGFCKEGGDCSHIDVSGMEHIVMQPNVAYKGNVSFLHNSMEMPFDCKRTVVRLNVPGV